MNDYSLENKPIDYLGVTATQALRAALRTKRQDKAHIIIEIEGSIYTFTPANWIKLCAARADGQHGQYAKYGAQFLGPIYTNCTAYTQPRWINELKAIANTLADNIAHPAALTVDDLETIRLLYETIPTQFREGLFVDQATAHLVPDPIPDQESD